MWPYIWPAERRDLKLRVAVAMLLLLAAKLVTIAAAHDRKQRAAVGGGHFTFQCFGRARIGIHSADWPGLTGRKRRPSNPSHIRLRSTPIHLRGQGVI